MELNNSILLFQQTKIFYVNYSVSTMETTSSICGWLQRGLCHKTKEDAIAYAKAMCGIKD